MAQSIYAISFPVTTGDVVKQGHADYCRDNGHATWEEDGVDKGVCPRCGTVTRSGWQDEAITPEPTPAEIASAASDRLTAARKAVEAAESVAAGTYFGSDEWAAVTTADLEYADATAAWRRAIHGFGFDNRR